MLSFLNALSSSAMSISPFSNWTCKHLSFNSGLEQGTDLMFGSARIKAPRCEIKLLKIRNFRLRYFFLSISEKY